MSEYKHYQDGLQSDDGYKTHHKAVGGCPIFVPATKNYNVIKYYSDHRELFYDDETKPTEPACSPTPTKSLGVISDGKSFSTVRGTPNDFISEYRNGADTRSPIPNVETRFLNINNARQVSSDTAGYGDNCRKSIMSVPSENELRVADGSGDYVFNLYQKSVSKTIVDPETGSESTEAVDSMEWMFFHSKVEACQKGWVWLELYDFLISGYSNDNTLYAYYWESTKEEASSLSGQLTYDDVPFDGGRALGGENRCVQAVKLSDIVGANKKLIIGLNRFTTQGEEIYINVIVGLKPSDIARSYQYQNSVKAGTTTGEMIYKEASFDEIGADVVFKYKKAEFKFGGNIADTWNNKPIFYPNEGLINVRAAPHARTMYAEWAYLDGDQGQGDNDNNTDGIGFSNGGLNSIPTLGFDISWATPQYFNFQTIYGGEPMLTLATHSNFTMNFSVMSVFEINKNQLKAGELFSMRMPRALSSWSGSANSFDEYDPNYIFGSRPSTFSSASVNISLYVGKAVTVDNLAVKWHDLSASFYKIKSWTLDDYCSTNRAPYDYIAPESPETHKDGLSNGYPRYAPNEDSDHIDNYKYVSIDMDDIQNNLDTAVYYFYLTLETANSGIKNGALTYSIYDDNPSPPAHSGGSAREFYPTGYHIDDFPTTYTTANIIFKNEYDIEYATPANHANNEYSFGSYIHKSPQIIDKTEKPISENYYQ